MRSIESSEEVIELGIEAFNEAFEEIVKMLGAFGIVYVYRWVRMRSVIVCWSIEFSLLDVEWGEEGCCFCEDVGDFCC